MYGLPRQTEINKPLFKTKIFEKFTLTASQREAFDADISRMFISHVVAESTLPTIKAGSNITDFYVIEVSLKQRDYTLKNIEILAKFIPRKILFILHYEELSQFAIYYTKLIKSDWQKRTELNVDIVGLDLDAVWENIVKSIGNIEVEEGNTLTEQIREDDERSKIKKEIQALQKQLDKEKQFNKQIEINALIKALKKKLK